MKKRAYEILGKRNMVSASIPVGSRLGRKLLHSDDAKAIMVAVRNAVKNGKGERVILTDIKLKAELTKEL